MDRTADIARQGLNYVMDFDHVIQVHADGSVTDAPTDTRSSWAPEFNGDSATGTAELDGDGWSIMSDGYTGQQGGGNVMHNSESIGGRLERDILATPGYYVAVVCTWTPDDVCTCEPHVTRHSRYGYTFYCETEQNAYCNFECECGADDAETVAEGWAVAYRESL